MTKMPGLIRVCTAVVLMAGMASPGVAQEMPLPQGVVEADGTSAVEREFVPGNRRLTDPVAPPAIAPMGLSPFGPLGAELVRPNLDNMFELGPGTALRVSSPPGFNPSRSVPDKVISLFSVLYRGVPLSKGSDIVTVIGGDGRLLYERHRNIPTKVDGHEGKIGSEEARKIARDDFFRLVRNDDMTVGEPERQIWVSPDREGRLSWNFVVDCNDPRIPIAIEYWISALTGEVLRRENASYFFEGTVTGDVWTGSAFHRNDTASIGLPRLRLASETGDEVIADNMGNFTSAGTGTATFTGSLAGPTGVVRNLAGAALTAKGAGTASAPISVHFAAKEEFEVAQTSAYYWVHTALDMAAPVLVDGKPDLAKLPIHVNSEGTCNAEWIKDNKRPYVRFFRSDNKCPNTAYSDIAFHEMGHGVDQVNGGIVNEAYSEGFGDALALFGTRQSCVGRDFYGQDTCLREASLVVKWPADPSRVRKYELAKVYAGFTWELINQLRDSLPLDEALLVAKQLVLSVAKTNPKSIPGAVHSTFVADNDDEHLATCSPHQKQIFAAAVSRNLPVPPPCSPSPVFAPSKKDSPP